MPQKNPINQLMTDYEAERQKEMKSAWQFAIISTLGLLAVGIFIFVMDIRYSHTGILAETLGVLWLVGLLDSLILAENFPPGSRMCKVCWIVMGLTFFGGPFLLPLFAH